MGAVSQLNIRTVEDGGFCVSVPAGFGDCGHDVFAASTLDDALAYVRKRMQPEPKAGEPPTLEQIAEAGAIEYRAFARDLDQGALSRQAMAGAVNRRNGNTWRV